MFTAWMIWCLLVPLVTMLIYVSAEKEKEYRIINASNEGQFRYNPYYGYALFRKPSELSLTIINYAFLNKTSVQMQTVEKLWHLDKVRQNVYRISDARCSGKCGFWYASKGTKAVLYLDKDMGDLWKILKYQKAYTIQSLRGCDLDGKPFPCDAYLSFNVDGKKYVTLEPRHQLTKWKIQKKELEWPG